MRDHVLERGTIEERHREHVQGVEPAASLTDVLDDEIAREVALEPVLVFKRIVNLGVRHRARLKPAVQDLWNAAHG